MTAVAGTVTAVTGTMTAFVLVGMMDDDIAIASAAGQMHRGTTIAAEQATAETGIHRGRRHGGHENDTVHGGSPFETQGGQSTVEDKLMDEPCQTRRSGMDAFSFAESVITRIASA